MLGTLVSKFFPPPPFISSPFYLLPVTRVVRVGTRGMRFATRTCVRAQFITRDREMARGCASPRRRDNEEDSSFHGNLSYGPLWWPFASMPRRLRDQRRATRNIISTVLPRRAARSDESVFPRDTGGILQFLVGTKLSTVYYVNIIRISGFSRAEKILRRRSSYF